jgi:hypothetical protein
METPPREIISREALVALHAVVQQVRAMVPPDVAERLDEDIQSAVADFATAMTNPAGEPADAVRLFGLLNFDAMARAYVRLFSPPTRTLSAGEVRSYVAASVDNLRGALAAIGAGVLSSARPFVESPERLEVELLAHIERHIKVLRRLLRPPVVPNQPHIGAHDATSAVPYSVWRAAHENVLALLDEQKFAEAADAFSEMMLANGTPVSSLEICEAVGHTQPSEFSRFRAGKASTQARKLFSAALSRTPDEFWASLEAMRRAKRH